MEENKEISCSEVGGSCLSNEKFPDAAAPPPNESRPVVCETKDRVSVDGQVDHVGRTSSVESPKECEKNLPVPAESNISSESRTHAQVNSRDGSVGNSYVSPTMEPSVVLGKSICELSSNDQVSESIIPNIKNNGDKKLFSSSTESPLCENVLERVSNSENTSEVIERALISDKSQDKCSVGNVLSKPLGSKNVLENVEGPRVVRSECAENKVDCVSLKENSSNVNENVDVSEVRNDDLLDSVSNVGCKENVQESDLECVNADNSQLEEIALCENSCDRDIKQMESVNIDEKNFSDRENEPHIETDPLLGNTSEDGADQKIASGITKSLNVTGDSANETYNSANDNFDLTETEGVENEDDDVQELEDVTVNEDIGMEIGDPGLEIGDPLMNSEDSMLEMDEVADQEVGNVEQESESNGTGTFVGKGEDTVTTAVNSLVEGEDEETVNDTKKTMRDAGDVALSSHDKVHDMEVTAQNPDDVQSMEDVQKSEEVNKKSEKLCEEFEDLSQECKDVSQESKDVSQESKDLSQESKNVSQESKDVAQESKDIAQESKDVAQVSEAVAPESEDAVPESEDVVPESDDVAPEFVDVTPEFVDVTPESVDVTPESVDVAPESVDVAPESVDVAPESVDVAPESVDVAPESVDVAPESVIVAPESVVVAPESVDVVSESEVIMMDTEESMAPSENLKDTEEVMDIDECAVDQETSVTLKELNKKLDNSAKKNKDKSLKNSESDELKGAEKSSLHVDEDSKISGENEACIENSEVELGASKAVELTNIEDEINSEIGANSEGKSPDEVESSNVDSSKIQNTENGRTKEKFIEIDLSETDENTEKSVPKSSQNKDDQKDTPAPDSDGAKLNEAEEEMDVEVNAENYGKSSNVMDSCEAIDVSAMCETVIEEGGTSIDLGIPSTTSVSIKIATKESKKQGKTSSGVEDDEEICIIPDSVPKGKKKVDQKTSDEPSKNLDKGKAEVSKGRKFVKPTELEKLGDISPEPRRTPGRPQRQAAKRAECQIKEIAADEEETEEANMRSCDNCYKVRNWITSLKFQENGVEKYRYFCTHECASNYKRMAKVKVAGDSVSTNTAESGRKFTRKCSQCSSFINGGEHTLSWETMDYCNEDCLGKYQKAFGSQCANCKGTVAGASLGKYCVRFGYDVKQFCCSGCLEEFKKGLKSCSYCLKDISGGSEGFLAPVGDKGQFKDFCTQSCMEKYDQMSNHNAPPVVVQECAVCNNEKVVAVEVVHKNQVNKFCSEPCFAAFRFVNGMVADQCFMCKKYFDKKEVENFSVYSDDLVHSFCSKTCMNVYILANRKIFPCHWCKVKKYNFDMIKKVLGTGQLLLVCSLNCLSLYESSVNGSRKRMKCDMCCGVKTAQYQLHMTDSSTRNFCSYQCAVQFQDKFSSTVGVVPTPVPADTSANAKSNGAVAFPVISSVQSLAADGSVQNNPGVSTRSVGIKVSNAQQNSTQAKVVRQIIVRPPAPKQMRNKAISCRPPSHTKGTHCRPIVCTKETQTDDTIGKTVLIPVPVPIYVPSPMCMYSNLFPIPTPFPLPVPVPIFIPTTRNSAKGIMKEIKKIQDKIPTDPFEAELLMMAEIVAGEKKEENSDSDSDGGDNTASGTSGVAGLEETSNIGNTEERYTPEAVDASNTFGDDMLQMALKMATELEEPTDLEAALTPSTITPQSQSVTEHQNSAESEDDPEPVQPVQELRSSRGRKRTIRMQRTTVAASPSAPAKRRRTSNVAEPSSLPPPEPHTQPVEQEKPDANMCLKYTLGVNAWKRWVLTKNAELEKAAASNRKLKLFKTEILQQTADELNYSLCLFVKEVRKPNGQEYAPDTIYYLCLGIQQYLFENGRIDNIFTDPYYEKFTECLDEVAKKFATLYNDSQYIVTRVEEEHLWESKQLGAHSPHVLLSTLMFFNTKHFNLTTVEEHMQLSFSHIMKHWKRNPNQSGTSKGPGGSRNVLLRFYPPQSALDANSKKKKVYEQQENEENPLRCPVKLYEFYLSKCPESVKTRNDVFYLLPERSCVPDSPVWYSTMALGKEPLMKMLHRVKMVKEINQALLKS